MQDDGHLKPVRGLRDVSFCHCLIPDSFLWSLIPVDMDSMVHSSQLRTSSKIILTLGHIYLLPTSDWGFLKKGRVSPAAWSS